MLVGWLIHWLVILGGWMNVQFIQSNGLDDCLIHKFIHLESWIIVQFIQSTDWMVVWIINSNYWFIHLDSWMFVQLIHWLIRILINIFIHFGSVKVLFDSFSQMIVWLFDSVIHSFGRLDGCLIHSSKWTGWDKLLYSSFIQMDWILFDS